MHCPRHCKDRYTPQFPASPSFNSCFGPAEKQVFRAVNERQRRIMYGGDNDGFAAKRMRKLTQRRAVDYTNTVIRYTQVSSSIPFRIFHFVLRVSDSMRCFHSFLRLGCSREIPGTGRFCSPLQRRPLMSVLRFSLSLSLVFWLRFVVCSSHRYCLRWRIRIIHRRASQRNSYTLPWIRTVVRSIGSWYVIWRVECFCVCVCVCFWSCCLLNFCFVARSGLRLEDASLPGRRVGNSHCGMDSLLILKWSFR